MYLSCSPPLTIGGSLASLHLACFPSCRWVLNSVSQPWQLSRWVDSNSQNSLFHLFESCHTWEGHWSPSVSPPGIESEGFIIPDNMINSLLDCLSGMFGLLVSYFSLSKATRECCKLILTRDRCDKIRLCVLQCDELVHRGNKLLSHVQSFF